MSLDLDTILDALADRVAAKVTAAQVQAMPNLNELLTVPQIARELRIRQETVKALIDAGTIERAADIRERRVSRRELERFTGGKRK